ncbi:MAG: tol-pal system-associated acyl-CoA thioesterase [Ectothiorhodospiraceae bacterium]|nr:tol-pal system-associated acyl-CoA thioesterase [Ectothiorhodospiraceae bacterium]
MSVRAAGVDEELEAAPFVWPVRVYYEDTDSAGIVYYASYLRFLERARTEWLRSRGFEHRALAREFAVVFTVSRLGIEYLRPARLDDRLEVTVAVARRGGASITLRQEVRQEDGERLCRADVRIACVDAERLRPCAIPRAISSEL